MTGSAKLSSIEHIWNWDRCYNIATMPFLTRNTAKISERVLIQEVIKASPWMRWWENIYCSVESMYNIQLYKLLSRHTFVNWCKSPVLPSTYTLPLFTSLLEPLKPLKIKQFLGHDKQNGHDNRRINVGWNTQIEQRGREGLGLAVQSPDQPVAFIRSRSKERFGWRNSWQWRWWTFFT